MLGLNLCLLSQVLECTFHIFKCSISSPLLLFSLPFFSPQSSSSLFFPVPSLCIFLCLFKIGSKFPGMILNSQSKTNLQVSETQICVSMPALRVSFNKNNLTTQQFTLKNHLGSVLAYLLTSLGAAQAGVRQVGVGYQSDSSLHEMHFYIVLCQLF